jgi:hypothetical protein
VISESLTIRISNFEIYLKQTKNCVKVHQLFGVLSNFIEKLKS